MQHSAHFCLLVCFPIYRAGLVSPSQNMPVSMLWLGIHQVAEHWLVPDSGLSFLAETWL